MSIDPKNYELAYLLSPAISEQEALTQVNKISMLIEEAEGVVERAEQPHKRMLAYPIKKQTSAYWGCTKFRAAPTAIASLEKKLVGAGLLRFLMVEKEREEAPRPIRSFAARAPRGAPTTPTARERPAAEEALDLEALDKRLEEILGS